MEGWVVRCMQQPLCGESRRGSKVMRMDIISLHPVHPLLMERGIKKCNRCFLNVGFSTEGSSLQVEHFNISNLERGQRHIQGQYSKKKWNFSQHWVFLFSGPGGEFHHRPNSGPSQQLVIISFSLSNHWHLPTWLDLLFAIYHLLFATFVCSNMAIISLDFAYQREFSDCSRNVLLN